MSKPLKSNSQFGQDIWVIQFFQQKRNGFFLEIGAGDGLYISNTLLLEKEFGWTGILVEPTSAFDKLKNNRPNCICDNSCIASERKKVTLFEVFNRGQSHFYGASSDNTLSSAVRDDLSPLEGVKLNSFYEVFKRAYQKDAVPLVEVLDKYRAPDTIDYFSLDVEGYEYEVLKNFDFRKYTFLCLSIERPSTEVHTFLEGKGYRAMTNRSIDVMYVKTS